MGANRSKMLFISVTCALAGISSTALHDPCVMLAALHPLPPLDTGLAPGGFLLSLYGRCTEVALCRDPFVTYPMYATRGDAPIGFNSTAKLEQHLKLQHCTPCEEQQTPPPAAPEPPPPPLPPPPSLPPSRPPGSYRQLMMLQSVSRLQRRLSLSRPVTFPNQSRS